MWAGAVAQGPTIDTSAVSSIGSPSTVNRMVIVCVSPDIGSSRVAMFTVCSLLDTPIEQYVRESLPFLLAILALVAVLLFAPGLVLFLPNLAFG